MSTNHPPIVLPNVRKVFIPDPGYVMFEADLKGADAQVVAWEADDRGLKAAFKAGLDVHSQNAEEIWGADFTRLKGPERYAKRQVCKSGVHGTNYGGTARGLASRLNWTTHEAEKFQNRWFSIHPGIREWHDRIRRQLETNRTIQNAFGFRRVFFDRIDNCFTEALAWIPQSTVAINTYYGSFRLEDKYFPDPNSLAGLLLQTHDSINFQFPVGSVPPASQILKTLEVVTPYPDPLVIPWDLKSSTKSWGDMEAV